jgi:putative hydrolase of the HAD superfamily
MEAINQTRHWYWSEPERHRQGRMNMEAARRHIVRLAFAKLALESSEIADELADAFTQQREELVRPFPGAVETLRALRERGARMALITNGTAQFQRRKIERFGLKPYFELILIEGEFGAGKPEEVVYRHVLERLGVPAREAWMVGDNLEWDVAAPQRLGLTGVWVDRAGTGLAAGSAVRPDRVIREFRELADLTPSP